jgi:hypothetical protein
MRRIFVLAFLAACSSRGGSPAAPAAPSPPASQPGAAAPAPAPADDRPLTEDDCSAMIGHIVDVGMEAQRRTKPADKVPTADAVAEIKAKMIESMMPQCLQFDRASWKCAMDATTEAALDDCAQPPAP